MDVNKSIDFELIKILGLLSDICNVHLSLYLIINTLINLTTSCTVKESVQILIPPDTAVPSPIIRWAKETGANIW